MKFLLVRALLVVVAVDGARIKEEMDNRLDVNSDNTWYRSCDTLQKRFVTGSKRLQDLVDSTGGSETPSVKTQMHLVLKSSAILRTLRRSQACPWVVSGHADDIQAVGDVVRSVLAHNPCTSAAMAELQKMQNDDGKEGNAPVGKAMSILLSDTCEVGEFKQPEDFDASDIVDPANLEIEEEVMDGIEEIMMSESANSSPSLLETHRPPASYMLKVMGAIMLGVFFVLQCANTAFWVAGFIGLSFTLMSYGFSRYTGLFFNAWRGAGKTAILGGLGSSSPYLPALLFASAAYLGGATACGSFVLSKINSTGVLDNGGGVTNLTAA